MWLVSYNYYKCFYYINVSITTLILVINIAIVIIAIKSDNYLLQFVCRMTFDVKFSLIFLFIFSLFKSYNIIWIKITWAV